MEIAVIGSGAWGTALAQVLVDNHHQVKLYGRSVDEISEINNYHTNQKYLPGIQLPPSLIAMNHLGDAVRTAEMIILAVPVIALREVLPQLVPFLKGRPILVNTAKGFDPQTGDRLSNLIRTFIPVTKRKEVVTLIGPSYAEEVAQRLYTAVSAVCLDNGIAQIVQTVFSNPYFRVYTLHDEVGAEYAAATKNIMALAAGIISGLGFKDNTRAALITRGLSEMMKLGTLKGGQIETFLGLTGVGDLTLTCSSTTSRNFQAGLAIGKANQAASFLTNNQKTVEGILATKKVYEESVRLGLDMPITAAVYKVLYDHQPVDETITALMNRRLKHEFN